MLHNNMVDLTKVKSNLEEALTSQLLLMVQNSGRAGQFAGQFVGIYDSLDRINKMLSTEVSVEEPTKETTKPKKDTK